MKRMLLFCCMLLPFHLMAQTVENIRVAPEGDDIKITYRIGGSMESQLYNVVLSCSMDGGQRFTPRTVEGDVGENIRGGKSIYTILWDVFEDVEEVGDVEFFVKVDLISDDRAPAPRTIVDTPVEEKQPEYTAPVEEEKPEVSLSTKAAFDRWVYFGYSGSVSSPIGISFGSWKNFGFYLGMRTGNAEVYYYDDVNWVTHPWNVGWIVPNAGLTKYLYGFDDLRIHAYAGAGATVIFARHQEDSYYDTDYSYVTLDGGLTVTFNALYASVGVEWRMDEEIELIPILNMSDLHKPAVSFGIGFMF